MMINKITKPNGLQMNRSLHKSMILDPLTHCTFNVFPTHVVCEGMHAQDFIHNSCTYIKKNHIYVMNVRLIQHRCMYHYKTIVRRSPTILIHPSSLSILGYGKLTSNVFVRLLKIRKHRLLFTHLHRPQKKTCQLPLTLFVHNAIRATFHVNGSQFKGVLTCIRKRLYKFKQVVRL